MDFIYVRTWAGFVYVAFILDVFAQKIVAWNVAPTKAVELVTSRCGCACGSATGRPSRSCAAS